MARYHLVTEIRGAAHDGGCHLRHTWVVATTKRWMNVLAPLARPAFSRNHSVVMRDFASGLAGRLDAPLMSVTGQAIKPGEPGLGELSPSTAP